MFEEIKEALKTKTGRMYLILEALAYLSVIYIGVLLLMMFFFAKEVI